MMRTKKAQNPTTQLNKDLFGNDIPTPIKTKGKPKTNPLIPLFGPGPEGKKCRDCAFQYFKVFQNQYSKCQFHTNGRHDGASTDHSSRYEACGKFEEKTDETITHKHFF